VWNAAVFDTPFHGRLVRLAGWLAGWRMVDVGLWAFSSGTSINMTKQWICEKNNR